jgi:hypothetical protein
VTPIVNGVGDCTVGAKSDAYSPVVQRNPDALVLIEANAAQTPMRATRDDKTRGSRVRLTRRIYQQPAIALLQ